MRRNPGMAITPPELNVCALGTATAAATSPRRQHEDGLPADASP
jgi:hypothetical protein